MPTKTYHIIRTCQVICDYYFIPRSPGNINITISLSLTVTVIQHQLSKKGSIYLPIQSPNRNKHTERTLHIPWGYQFIPRSCRNISLNSCLIFTVIIKGPEIMKYFTFRNLPYQISMCI